MKRDCRGCFPTADSTLCAVHRSAFRMREVLREIADAYLERAAAVVARQPEPDQARLPRVMGEVSKLLSEMGREELRERS